MTETMTKGIITRVNGPIVEARDMERAGMLEVVEVGEERLIGEVIRIRAGGVATIQVYENTSGLKPGEGVYCTTRPILLKGKGGTLKNSSDSPFVFGGISSASGESVALTLAGDTAATNEVWHVRDGEGTTSLVKAGEGTWTLCGTNAFSGTVTVKAGTLIVKNLSEFNYDWFKWTIKERGGTNSSQLNIRASEFGIYDGANTSNRMNYALKTYTAYGSKVEGTLPAGMAGYWHPAMLTESNSSRPLSGLFDGGSVWTQMGLPNGEPNINEESTWIPVVMHLADNRRRAKTFDVAQRTSGSNYYAYKTFSMSGSLDGIHWDVLTNVTLTSFAQSDWSFSGGTPTADSIATHTGGCPIAGGPEGTANALEGVSSVSVAVGARLVAQGAATIPGLTVDAAGAGTVDGFAFAESGTLDVLNLPAGGGALPGTYVNCTGFENIRNWTLTAGGNPAGKYRMSVSGDSIRIVPVGIRVVVR